jgi:cold shock protein
MEKGTVKLYHSERDFGFIELESGGDVAEHFSAIQDEEIKSLEESLPVIFEIEEGQLDPQATKVFFKKLTFECSK